MNASELLLTEVDSWKVDGARGERMVLSSLKLALSSLSLSFSTWPDPCREFLRSRLRLCGRLGSA